MKTNKRFMSIMAAAVLSANALYMPLSAHAEESNPDLYAMASSLGADTDCFNFNNFTSPEMHEEAYHHLLPTLTNYDMFSRDHNGSMHYNANAILSGGMCRGISALTVLAHNGVISPSDLQEGAETLSDITLDNNLTKYLHWYQANQAYQHHAIYDDYLMYNDIPAEKAKEAIEIVQNAMNNGRYVYIAFGNENMGHAVVGIGVADGTWTFDGNTYDKCILTLDSNSDDEEKNHVNFEEETCIYINSETGKFYIPKYVEYITDDIVTYIHAVDNDDVLNYDGMLNPSNERMEGFYDNYNSVLIYDSNYDIFNDPDNHPLSITVTENDGSQYDLYETAKFYLTPIFKWRRQYYTTGTDFHIECANEREDDGMYIFLENIKRYAALDLRTYYPFTMDVNNEEFYIDFENDAIIPHKFEVSWCNNEDNYDFAPNNYIQTTGRTTGDVYMRQVDGGFIIGGTNGIMTSLVTESYSIDEEGYTFYDTTLNCDINLVKDVFVTFDEANNAKFMLDLDDDGVYESEQQKGDVNADGVINPVDATLILQQYVQNSMDSQTSYYLNEDFSDINDDDVLDPVDATAVLRIYTENSMS